MQTSWIVHKIMPFLKFHLLKFIPFCFSTIDTTARKNGKSLWEESTNATFASTKNRAVNFSDFPNVYIISAENAWLNTAQCMSATEQYTS